jgi:hypothetical protein
VNLIKLIIKKGRNMAAALVPVPPVPILNVDLRHYNTPAGVEDIVRDTGNIDLVINDILAHPHASTLQKVIALMECLSQILSWKDKKYLVVCENALVTVLSDYAKTDSRVVLTVTEYNHFKNSRKLKETIEKLNYLASGIFGYNRVSKYTARVGHHLKQTYFKNTYNGFAIMALGTGLFFLGGVQTAVDSSAVDAKIRVARGLIGIGAFLVIFPFLLSLYLATKDDV